MICIELEYAGWDSVSVSCKDALVDASPNSGLCRFTDAIGHQTITEQKLNFDAGVTQRCAVSTMKCT